MSLRILITGCSGYIGGRLALALNEAGHEVILGSRQDGNIVPLLRQGTVVRTEWDSPTVLKRCCEGVAVVIHAAGMNMFDCAQDPIAALEFNGVATARLVSAAARAGVKRLIYLSTAHVYASPLIGEITEQACPRNLHPYAASHLAGEAAVLGASQRAEIHGVVLRLSNVFGAPARREVSCWNLVVNDLCRQAVETRKLVLRTSGTQYRDFVAMQHVCRVVDYLTCRSCEYTEPLLFNVGAGLTRSIYQIAELVQLRCARLFGFEPLIQRPPHEGEPPAVPFVYCVERLAAEGIVFDSNTILEEMDGLMTFCAKNRNVTLN